MGAGYGALIDCPRSNHLSGVKAVDWREEIAACVTETEIRLDEPMAKHTSFRIGGPADVLAMPGSRVDLRRLVDLAYEHGLPWFILGRGTNLLVRDGGIRGLVIKPGPCLRWMEWGGEEAAVGAGVTLAELANEAASHSLAGLAFAAGIPGTLGGGIYMNAGAYGGELVQVVTSVTAYYPGCGERIWQRDQLELSYRASRFQKERAVIEGVTMRLPPGREPKIRQEMALLACKRQEKQPLSLPSAGSVFRRPSGGYAGTMIERAGLKGLRIGDAQVSELHANFIVNLGHAKAGDVLSLINQVRERVAAQTGIWLEPEIRVIGEA